MRPAFAGHPPALAVLVASLAVWAVLEIRQGLRRRSEASNHDRGSVMVVRLTTMAGILLAARAIGLTALDFAYDPAIVATGIALVWAGIALRAWCFVTLGRYFTFTVQTSADQPLITNGPYRWLRHPSYLALLMIGAGIGIAYENPVSLVAIVGGMIVGLAYRIRVEEAALRAVKGSAFDEYAAGRKRILPFLW